MLKPLIATFRPQSWINDRAIDIDGEKVFDATEALLTRFDLEGIRSFEHLDYDSDMLSEGLPERSNHSGPFEVDVDIDEWLEENGVPSRKAMTEQDLARLREDYLAN